MVERPIKKVTMEEMVIAIKAIKPGKAAAGASKVGAEIVSPSGRVKISVMTEFCQHVLNGRSAR